MSARTRTWGAVWGLVVLALPTMTGLGFIIAGRTAGNRGWTRLGVAMLLPWIPAIALAPANGGSSSAFDVVMWVFIAIWVGGIVFAWRIRRAWRAAAEPPPRDSSSARSFIPPQPAAPPAPPAVGAAGAPGRGWAPAPTPRRPPAAPAGAVRTPPHQATPRRHRPDVNRASTAELAALPGVEPEVAERVVQARAAGGPFASLQDLARRATLKPHELVPFASLADLTASTPPPRGGRVVDF